MKKIKKHIALLLAVTIFLSAFQLSAITTLAGITLSDESGETELINWSYSANTGTLYINGNTEDTTLCIENYGKLPTYRDDEWISLRFSHLVIGNNITKIKTASTATFEEEKYKYFNCSFDVTFEEGSQLTEIAKYAFCCSTLTSIEFPETLEVIGYEAFYDARLTELNFPSSIQSVGNLAFAYTNITSVTLPDSMTIVPDGCFAGCMYLQEVDLNNAIDIGASSFLNTGITDIDLTGIESIGGGAFAFTHLTEVNIPESVTAIGEQAFKYSSLAHINFSEDCEELEIGQYAFANCKGLQEVTIPYYVSVLDSYVFNECTNLTTVNFEVKNTDGGKRGLTHFYEYALQNSGVTEITLPETLTFLSGNSFENMRNLVKVDLSQTSILNIPYNCFKNTPALKQVIFSPRTKTLSQSCFTKSGIETITLPDNIKAITTSAFEDCKSLASIDLTNTDVSQIQQNAFKGCTALASVKLPNNLSNIGESAFEGCTALSDFEIPSKINSINANAFNGCSSLTSITLPSTLILLQENAFLGCPLTEAKILNPSLVLTNSKIGFANGTSASYMTIKGYAKSTAEEYANYYGMSFVRLDSQTGEEQTDDDSLRGTLDDCKWYIEEDTLYITTRFNGNITTNSFTTELGSKYVLAQLIEKHQIKSLVIGEGILSVPSRFLYNTQYDYSSLTSITLPSTLMYINSYAFAGAKIKSIDIPDSIIEIRDHAFYKADLSEGVTLGQGLRTIGEYAFANTNVPSVDIPLETSTIEKAAFLNCSQLKEMTIREGVVTINRGGSATRPIGFDSRGNRYDDFVMNVDFDSPALYYAKDFNIKYNPIVDGDYYTSGYFGNPSDNNCWYYNTETKNVYMNFSIAPDTTRPYFYYENGRKVNSGDMEVNRLYVDDKFTSVTSSNKLSIFEPFNPKSIKLPNSISIIYANGFAGLNRLQSIEIPDSVVTITAGAFKNCPSLQGIKLGKGITSLPSNAFKNLTSLKIIELPQNLTTIGQSAFEECTNLQMIEIPSTVTQIGYKAFYRCYAMTKIINNSRAYLESYAFADLPLLEEIVMNQGFRYEQRTGSDTPIITAFRNTVTSSRNLAITLGDDITSFYIANYRNAKVKQWNLGKNVATFGVGEPWNYVYDVTVHPENLYYYMYDNCLYKTNNPDDPSDDVLIKAMLEAKSITIKPGTTKLDEGAFYGSHIESIIIPDSVTEIGSFCFETCHFLKRVRLPKYITELSGGIFMNCDRLKTVEIPSAEIIDYITFKGCTSLSSVILPSNLKTLGYGVFADCPSLVGVVIPEGTQTIDDAAFYNCENLEELYIFNTEVVLSHSVPYKFKDCPKLVIHTLVGSNAYAYARENDIPYTAYTDEDIFYDLCAMKLDIYAGYLGFCTDGHGDIDYITVYEASCDYDGYVIGVCEYCSEILEEIHTDACGHNYVLTTSIPATETTQGMNKYVCENCSDCYYEYTPATNPDAEEVTCHITGKIVIATSGTATSGVAPLSGVSISINGYKLATTDLDGNFSLDLATGVYEMLIHYNYGIDRTVYIIADGTELDCGSIPVLACDWNKDGTINNDDLELFKIVISSQVNDPSYLTFVDMNNDGYINAKDMAIIRSCMNYDAEEYNSLVISNK